MPKKLAAVLSSDDSGDGYIGTCHKNTPTPFLFAISPATNTYTITNTKKSKPFTKILLPLFFLRCHSGYFLLSKKVYNGQLYNVHNVQCI